MYKSASFIILAVITVIACARDEFQSHQDQSSQLRQTRTVNISCMVDSDCSNHGYCRNKKCQCQPGYITWQASGECNYNQIPQLVAFLVSFFVGGLGVDWFLLARNNGGYVAAGVFKLLLPCGIFAGIPCIAMSRQRDSTALIVVGYVISILPSCGLSIWWLVDWIRILTNSFPDGNGAPLKPW